MRNIKQEEDLELLQKLKDSIKNKKRERDQAIGKRDALLTKLKNEFKVSNINSAKRLLQDLKEERKGLQKDFESKMEYLRENYEL